MAVDINNLKESNQFLNLLLDDIGSAIMLVDKEIQITGVNATFKTLFGKEEDLILGQICGNAIGCQYLENGNADCGSTPNCQYCPLRSAIVKAFLTREPTYQEVLKRDFYIGNKRIRKYLQFTTKFIHFNQEDNVLLILDDITKLEEQKLRLLKQNKELVAMNQQKNEMLGVAAHDLRSPVNQIFSFAQYLNNPENSVNEADRKLFLKIIEERSLYAQRLINDLLDYSKIEAGRIELQKQNVDYYDFIEKRVKLNSFQAQQKEIKLQFRKSPNKMPLILDEIKVEQVINNLITNAIKFSFPKSDVEINVIPQQDKMLTRIIDHGIGIQSDEQEKIFKAFKSGSKKGTLGEEGTGLGLAISKKIIEAHGGTIGVKSLSGHGSEFWFTLPLNPA